MKAVSYANIPMRFVGPIKFNYQDVQHNVKVPMATFETPLWPSTARGARLSQLCGGINVAILQDNMTRSLLLQGQTAQELQNIAIQIQQQHTIINLLIQKTSGFAKLQDIHIEIVGNLMYVRIAIQSGDAAGHNMATIAAEEVLKWLLAQYPTLTYVSISGNICCDKKVSAINGILGRGKSVVAEIMVAKQYLRSLLNSDAMKIEKLNIKKNLIGGILAGSIRSANAHFANMLLAVYLATGQDAANIVESSQGIVVAEAKQEDLYFSVSLPNIIVGTVGNGKQHGFVQENLAAMGCLPNNDVASSANKLAAIIAATVLCGELSLLAAQTNFGELTRSHKAIERRTKVEIIG